MTAQRRAPGDDPLAELAACRAEIEEVDRAILDLLARRVLLGRRIGALKRAAGLPTLDPAREAEVIRAISGAARELGLPTEPVRDIYWRIISLARLAQAEDEQCG